VATPGVFVGVLVGVFVGVFVTVLVLVLVGVLVGVFVGPVGVLVGVLVIVLAAPAVGVLGISRGETGLCPQAVTSTRAVVSKKIRNKIIFFKKISKSIIFKTKTHWPTQSSLRESILATLRLA